MTANVFVDSNILVYAHDADAGPKQKIAAAQVRAVWEDQSGRISTQVLQEIYVTVTQKLGKPLAKGNAGEIVRDLRSGWPLQQHRRRLFEPLRSAKVGDCRFGTV